MSNLNNRQSSVELGRVLCMLMVLVLHYNERSMNFMAQSGKALLMGCVLEAFCIVAVNVFVFFSGYFSIKLSARNIIKLYLRCFLIGLAAYVIGTIISGEQLLLRTLCSRLLAFTHNYWWFVISYLGLMFISPILNYGTAKLKRHDFLCVLGLLCIVEFYFAWWKNLELMAGGYCLIHFCYIYLIARFCALHISQKMLHSYRWGVFSCYVICAIISSLIAANIIPSFGRIIFAYNSPLVVLSSISLGLFIMSFSFQNRVINWIAASAFSAYLLQMSPYVGAKFLFAYERAFLSTIPNLYVRYAALLASAVLFFIIAVVIDKLLGLISIYLLKLYDTFDVKIRSII